MWMSKAKENLRFNVDVKKKTKVLEFNVDVKS
jgi:hypothetical protein